MSVVVAKITKDKIYISADSIVVRGWTQCHNTGNHITKLEEYNGIILGGCGSAEEISLFFHYIKTHSIEEATEKNILDFVIEFKKWKRDLTDDKSLKNNYIIAYQGKCFGISNMLIYEITNYDAIGAGMDYALGALHQGATTAEAVKAACDLCALVCEPIVTKIMQRNINNEISINKTN